MKDSWQMGVHSNDTFFLVNAFNGQAKSENLGTWIYDSTLWVQEIVSLPLEFWVEASLEYMPIFQALVLYLFQKWYVPNIEYASSRSYTWPLWVSNQLLSVLWTISSYVLDGFPYQDYIWEYHLGNQKQK